MKLTEQILKELIINEKKANPNKLGDTPLIILAKKNEKLPPDDEDKTKLEWILSKLGNSFDELNDEDMKTLSLFIQFCNFSHTPNIIKSYNNQLKKSLKQPEDILKRAEILRLLSDLGYIFLIEELNKEELIKQHYPWHWIYAAANSDFDSAIKFITKLLIEGQEFANLFSTLNLWLRKYDKEKIISALKNWQNLMKEKDREKLEKWLTKRNIYINPILQLNIKAKDFLMNNLKKEVSIII